MDESVKEFLYDLGLEQYYDIFITKGFDAESDMGNIQEDDLDCMGITIPSHRQLLLTAAFHYTPSEEHKLYKWLREHQLDYYYINFVRSELTDFVDLEKLNLPDETVYDELEIVLPGHKKRLEKAVHQLRLKRSSSVCPEEPLAVGKWGKPVALLDAKYDFLCVEAVIASTKTRGSSKTMDFMVDSGSDVVTLREEILEGLDLELLGTVRSKGVHASKEKRLYKAHLSIGHFTIEIEVMPESYDSLGSRVIRHFRHFIDGNRHVWLPGNLNELATPTNAKVQIQNTERTNLELSSSTSVVRDTGNVDDYTSTQAKIVELNKCDPSNVDPSALKTDSETLISVETGVNDSSVFAQQHYSGHVEPSLLLSQPTHPTEEQFIGLSPLLRNPDCSRLTERDGFLMNPEPNYIVKHSNLEVMPSSEKKIEQSGLVPSKRLKTSRSSTGSSCSEIHSDVLLKEESHSSQNESNLYMFKIEQSGRPIVTTETDITRTENSSICIDAGNSSNVTRELSRSLSPARSLSVIGTDFSGIPETQPQILKTEQIGSNIMEQETSPDQKEVPISIQTITNSVTSITEEAQVSDLDSSTSSDKSSTVQILSRLCGAPVNKCGNSSVKNAVSKCYCLPINEEILAFNCEYMQSICSRNNSDFSKLCNGSNISTRKNVRKRKLIEKPEVGSVPESPLSSVLLSAPSSTPDLSIGTGTTHTVTSLANFTLSSTSDIIPSKRKCQIVCGDTGVSLDYNLLLNRAFHSSKLASNLCQKADSFGRSDVPESTSDIPECEVHSKGSWDGFYLDKHLPSSLCLERVALSLEEEKHI